MKKKFLTDIEIAQQCEMIHIKDIANKLCIEEDDLEMYGKYKAKLPLKLIDENKIKSTSSISQKKVKKKDIIKLN